MKNLILQHICILFVTFVFFASFKERKKKRNGSRERIKSDRKYGVKPSCYSHYPAIKVYTFTKTREKDNLCA